MSHTLIKTVKMPLREPTGRKEQAIKDAMAETQKIQSIIADWMWSVPRYNWGTKTINTWYGWVSDRQGKIDHSLPAQSAQEAVQTVRESFLSYKSKGYQGNSPQFNKTDHVLFHNQQIKFNDKGTAVNLPFKAGRGHREWLPLNIGEYQSEYLQKYFDDKLRLGCGKLIDKGERYELHQVMKKELTEVEKPKYIVGVDLGRNNIASVAVIDRDGNKVTALPPIKGRELEEHRRTLDRIRQSRQQSDSDYHKKVSSSEEKFIDQKNHEYTKQIIDNVRDRLGQYATYKVVLEDLTDIRKNITEKHQNGRYRNRKEIRLINSWPYADFKEKLKYKVLEDAHTKIEDVGAAYTSQTCSDCGSRNTIRQSTRFRCKDCGYKGNADINAAFNIAKRSLTN